MAKASPLVLTIKAIKATAEKSEILTGEVTAFQLASTTQTTQFTVDFEGQGTGTPGVLACTGYATSTTNPPAVGDQVLCLRHQSDIYIIDSIQ